MPRYKYTGYSGGSQVANTIVASDKGTARAELLNSGIVIVSLTAASTFTEKLANIQIGSQSAKPAELAHIYESFADSASVGEPFHEWPRSARIGLPKRSAAAKSLDRMISNVGSLAPEMVLKKEKAVIGEEVSVIWNAAQSSSSPELIFEKLGSMARANAEITGKIRGAMIKPLFYVILLFVAAAAMTVLVAPKLTEVYASSGTDLPGLTQFVLGLSNFVQKNVLFLLLGGGVAFVASTFVWKTSPQLQLNMSRLANRTPVIGSVLRNSATQRICAMMGLLLSANTAQSTALKITADAIPSRSIKSSVLDARRGLSSMSFGDSIKQNLDVIDPKLASLAYKSEKGQADPGAGWHKYGEQKHRTLIRVVDSAIKLIDPVSMLVIGSVIGTFVIAFYMPMIQIADLTNSVTGG